MEMKRVGRLIACGVVAIAGYFVNYVFEIRRGTSNAEGANFLAVAQGCFAVGRFLGVFLMKFINPRKVFLVYFTGVLAFQAASIGAKGNSGLGMHLYLPSYYIPSTSD